MLLISRFRVERAFSLSSNRLRALCRLACNLASICPASLANFIPVARNNFSASISRLGRTTCPIGLEVSGCGGGTDLRSAVLVGRSIVYEIFEPEDFSDPAGDGGRVASRLVFDG